MRLWFEQLEEGLIALLLAMMTIITFAQVIARYVFNFSFVWALELVTFLFAWLIFIGMAYGVRVGSHIGIDAAVKLLGPRLGRAVTLLAIVLCIVYSVLVLTGSWTYIIKIYQIGNEAKDIAIPIWIPRLALPIGFALLTYRFCELLYLTVRGRSTHLISDEAEEALKLRVIDDKAPAQDPR